MPPDQPVRRGHHGVDRTGCRPPAASTIAEADAEDRLVPDSLSPVEARLLQAVATGTPVKRSVNGPPNARHLNRFSRYLSTTGPITVSRQERQIVQSCKTLDDSLPGFTPSWRHLISGRSVVQVHPDP